MAEITGLSEGSYTIAFSANENLSSLTYIIDEDTVVNTVQITTNTGQFVFSLTNTSSQVALVFTATDMSGNDVEFSMSLCSTCLEKGDVNNANDGSANAANDNISATENEDSDMTMVYALAVICGILLVALLVVSRRNNGESDTLPSGMPTKAEDSWISGYINRK